MRKLRKCAVAAATASLAGLGACSLDLKNPNSPTQDEVTQNVDAVIGLATGLQGRFSQSYGNFAYMAGLVTDEFSATSAALISISDAEQGAVPSGTAIADNVFNSVYRTVRTADELLTGSEQLATQIDPGTLSVDLCGLENGHVFLDRSLPTSAAHSLCCADDRCRHQHRQPTLSCPDREIRLHRWRARNEFLSRNVNLALRLDK